MMDKVSIDKVILDIEYEMLKKFENEKYESSLKVYKEMVENNELKKPVLNTVSPKEYARVFYFLEFVAWPVMIFCVFYVFSTIWVPIIGVLCWIGLFRLIKSMVASYKFDHERVMEIHENDLKKYEKELRSREQAYKDTIVQYQTKMKKIEQEYKLLSRLLVDKVEINRIEFFTSTKRFFPDLLSMVELICKIEQEEKGTSFDVKICVYSYGEIVMIYKEQEGYVIGTKWGPHMFLDGRDDLLSKVSNEAVNILKYFYSEISKNNMRVLYKKKDIKDEFGNHEWILRFEQTV